VRRIGETSACFLWGRDEGCTTLLAVLIVQQTARDDYFLLYIISYLKIKVKQKKYCSIRGFCRNDLEKATFVGYM